MDLLETRRNRNPVHSISSRKAFSSTKLHWYLLGYKQVNVQISPAFSYRNGGARWIMKKIAPSRRLYVRTMHANGDDFSLLSLIHTIPALVPKQPRMTRLGIFMRKTSLDKLL
jgi:hypothetical protein